ncbi:MAG: hypothetical protein AB8G05_20030 [Oligoflexales bacterium]
MRYLFLVCLSVFSSTLMAERFQQPARHYKISNYTNLKTSELAVEYFWSIQNGWGGTIKSNGININVNEDGAYTIPEINESSFSIWGVSFRSSLSIKDKTGKLIKIFYHVSSGLQNVALIDIKASEFEFSQELANPHRFEAKMEVEANPESSFDGWVDIIGEISNKFLQFPSKILVVPFAGNEDDIQFSFKLKLTSKGQNSKLIYVDYAYVYRYEGELGGDYGQNLLSIPVDMSQYIELNEPNSN